MKHGRGRGVREVGVGLVEHEEYMETFKLLYFKKDVLFVVSSFSTCYFLFYIFEKYLKLFIILKIFIYLIN